MKKKVSLLGLSALLAFYPTTVLAAETDSQENDVQANVTAENIEDSTESTNLEEAQVEDANNEEEVVDPSDEGTGEEAPVQESTPAEEDSTDGEAVEETEVHNTPEDSVSTDSPEINNETTNQANAQEEATNELSDEDQDNASNEEVSGEDESSSSEVAPLDDEVGEGEDEEEQLDEDLDLTKIYGAITQPYGTSIQYDFNKGYYVLELQAGLNNMSDNQVLTNKWVAFALPDGVELAYTDVPAGVVQLPVNEKNGLAIKVPDVQESPDSKYVYLDIPLIGEPNDNDPVENLYLYNVNVDERTYEDLGQIKSQRNIDFSPMEGTPEIDIDANLNGAATFNEDGYYVLDLTVQAENNSGVDVNSIYAGFTLPDGVAIIEPDNYPVPDGIELLNLGDGVQAVAVKLPELGSEDNGEITYQIPLIGKTDSNVTSSTITAYTINGSYQEVGQLNGSVHIDLSDMDETWDFNAESQIVRDFPGLENNQFGLRFGFNTKNLTVDDIDRVKVEFQVPNALTVHEPDSYSRGSIPDSLKGFLNDGLTLGSEELDITWDGNKATINLDTIEGASTYQGFFTAFAESNASLDNLEGLDVTVTLYQNGEEIVQELNVPFEIVSYDGEDDPDENNNQNDGNDENTNNDNNSDQDSNNNNVGNENKDESNNTEDKKAPVSEDNDEDNDSQTGNEEDDSATVSVESSSDNGDGSELPQTATNMYNFLLFGAILLTAGGALLFTRNRKARTN